MRSAARLGLATLLIFASCGSCGMLTGRMMGDGPLILTVCNRGADPIEVEVIEDLGLTSKKETHTVASQDCQEVGSSFVDAIPIRVLRKGIVLDRTVVPNGSSSGRPITYEFVGGKLVQAPPEFWNPTTQVLVYFWLTVVFLIGAGFCLKPSKQKRG